MNTQTQLDADVDIDKIVEQSKKMGSLSKSSDDSTNLQSNELEELADLENLSPPLQNDISLSKNSNLEESNILSNNLTSKNKLKLEDNLSQIKSHEISKKPKLSFWKRLFSRKKSNKVKPLKIKNSGEELNKISEIRRGLGLNDLPLPSKPKLKHFDLPEPPSELVKTDINLSKDDYFKDNFSNDDGKLVDDSLKIELAESTPEKTIDDSLKKDLGILRKKLGISKPSIDIKEIYDKLESDSKENSKKLEDQYDKEQDFFEDENSQQNNLLTDDEVEDFENDTIPEATSLVDDKIVEDLDEDISKNNIVENKPIKQENLSTMEKELPNHSPYPEKELLNESNFPEEKLENKSISSTETLLDSTLNPAKDKLEDNFNSIEKELPNHSSYPEKELPNESNFPEKEITFKKQKQLNLDELNEELSQTNEIIDDLKNGKIPKEDLLFDLKKEIADCNSLIENKDLLAAKYAYNKLCNIFEKIDFKDQEKTIWYGVLKKIYQTIINSEKN